MVSLCSVINYFVSFSGYFIYTVKARLNEVLMLKCITVQHLQNPTRAGAMGTAPTHGIQQLRFQFIHQSEHH